jgi:hypothetical protein
MLTDYASILHAENEDIPAHFHFRLINCGAESIALFNIFAGHDSIDTICH